MLTNLGPTAPTPDADDIFQLSGTSVLGGYATDGFGGDNASPGSTFTTDTNPAGYTLTAITMRVGDQRAGGNTAFQLRVGSAINGFPDTFTQIGTTETFTTATSPVNGSWVQFTLGTPFTRAASTYYVFGIDRGLAQGFGYIQWSLNASNTPYLGGGRLEH